MVVLLFFGLMVIQILAEAAEAAEAQDGQQVQEQITLSTTV
jgi:hypothetical protein